MLTDKERDRILQERDHAGFIRHPELWPRTFFLPVIKAGGAIRDGADGVITALYGFNVVVHVNLFLLQRSGKTLLQAVNEGAKISRYETVEALVADGWEVD
jgi:hypothetical protein